MALKDKLKQYRKETGLTQKELANALGVSRTNIAEMEAGRVKGTLKTLTKLSTISNKGIGYWTDTNEIIIKNYEALDILINSMLEKKIIKSDGKIPDEYKEIILGVLEKEIAYKIEQEKEED